MKRQETLARAVLGLTAGMLFTAGIFIGDPVPVEVETETSVTIDTVILPVDQIMFTHCAGGTETMDDDQLITIPGDDTLAMPVGCADDVLVSLGAGGLLIGELFDGTPIEIVLGTAQIDLLVQAGGTTRVRLFGDADWLDVSELPAPANGRIVVTAADSVYSDILGALENDSIIEGM